MVLFGQSFRLRTLTLAFLLPNPLFSLWLLFFFGYRCYPPFAYVTSSIYVRGSG
jgi:hypothetical protein